MKFELLFSLAWEILAEQLMTMPEADVKRLSSFLDNLLTDVISRQVLPDAVNHVAKAFDLSFTFKPQINVNNDLNFCRARFTIEASHPTLSDISLTNDGPGLIP